MLEKLINLFFPERCACCGQPTDAGQVCAACRREWLHLDRWLCKICEREMMSCRCRGRQLFFDGITAPFCYGGAVRKAIHTCKFHGRRRLAPLFAADMAGQLKATGPDWRFDVICCVPLHKSRLRERGFNQCELIAREMSAQLDIPFEAAGLAKIRPTPSQHTLRAKERLQNLSGAFVCRKRFDGQTVLLIDDVSTTGATLDECAKMLKQAGAARVWACVLAAVG